MKDIKDVLLYLDSFDENNMFDLEHIEKLLVIVLEVLRSDMDRKAIPDLVVKIGNMSSLKKPGVLIEVKKLYDNISQYGHDTDIEDEFVDFDDYYELSEDSDTGENIGFRNM